MGKHTLILTEDEERHLEDVRRYHSATCLVLLQIIDRLIAFIKKNQQPQKRWWHWR